MTGRPQYGADLQKANSDLGPCAMLRSFDLGPLPRERNAWDALCERFQFDGEAIRTITSELLTVPSLVHDLCALAHHVLYRGRGYLPSGTSVLECLARADELRELPLSPGDAECWLLCRSILTFLQAGNGYLREIERQALAHEVALAFEAADRECHLSRLPVDWTPPGVRQDRAEYVRSLDEESP